MIESQLTETAAPGEGKAAARVANQRRQDTAPGLESKAKLLPSDRLRPQAEEAGRQLIRSWCDFGPRAASMIDPATLPGLLADVGAGVLDARTNHGARDFCGVYSHFIEAPQGIRDELIEANQRNGPLPENCRPLIDAVARWNKAFRLDLAADKLRQALDRGDDPGPALAEIAALENSGDGGTLAAQLAARAFDFDSHPEKPIPIFRLNDHPLCTPGNITNIQAPPKAGKSALVEACIAAVMNGNRQGPDTLGFSAENPQGRALIHFDTEQSRYDHDALIRRACRRAQVERPPSWLASYSLADLGIMERRLALRHAMAEAFESCGGILAVMIDGIGDLCADPNDPEEAFALVHELHALAIKYHAAIVTVLHENPGSESGKTRGHLGSQLERKAETNLRLAKDKDGITTVWAERARHCYLPKDQGHCFSWNDDRRMHTSCGNAGEIKSAANLEKMTAEAEAAFGGTISFRHSELMTAIGEALGIKERAAKLRVQRWAAEGIIRKDSSGIYRLTNP